MSNPSITTGKTAHTPGPWKLTESGKIKPQWAIEKGWGDYICEMTFSSLAEAEEIGPEELPNARLIEAAPELLAACRTALDALNQIPNKSIESGVHKNTYSVCSMLSALITKAEGR